MCCVNNRAITARAGTSAHIASRLLFYSRTISLQRHMHKESIENYGRGDGVPETSATLPEGNKEYSYAGYIAHGGRIDEENYTRVMETASKKSDESYPEDSVHHQTQTVEAISGISLDAIGDSAGIDPRLVYRILRTDVMSSGQTYHHGQMHDQQLLVETLRMLEETAAVNAVIAAHPNISFN